MKKPFAYSVVALAVLALASVAVAQNAITINGGGQTVLMKKSSVQIQKPYVRDSKLKTIFSNLGTGTAVYQEDIGWTISGADSGAGEEWTQGSAFTPTANATVTEIKVGFTWVEGDPNTGTIALYSNSKSGAPNKVLHTFKKVSNLPTFGQTSSILQTVKDAKGIKVKKGTQYWVVLSAPSTTWNVWNYNEAESQGNEAYNNGSGWTTRQSYLGAFAVLGN
jgi:hypothetical protein